MLSDVYRWQITGVMLLELVGPGEQKRDMCPLPMSQSLWKCSQLCTSWLGFSIAFKKTGDTPEAAK